MTEKCHICGNRITQIKDVSESNYFKVDLIGRCDYCRVYLEIDSEENGGDKE